MAKELPYFKFEPNQWENGNIQMLSREDKGLFIDLCSMYWSRLGDLPIKLAIMKLCNGNKNSLDELIENNIVTIKENNIKISFLEEQLSTFSLTSKNNTVNANIRWEKIPERITGNLVYVIRCWNKDEEFLKIGITKTSINRRFSGKIPYEYEAIIVDFYSDIELESQYSEIAKGCEYYAKKNFSGHLECYNISILPKLIDFANIRNAKYVRKQCENDAIREDKRKEDKKKENIINNAVFVSECKNSSQWLEVTAMQNKINTDTVKLFIDTFESHLIIMEEQKKTVKEYKEHFTHWFKKQDLSNFRIKQLGKTNQI